VEGAELVEGVTQQTLAEGRQTPENVHQSASTSPSEVLDRVEA